MLTPMTASFQSAVNYEVKTKIHMENGLFLMETSTSFHINRKTITLMIRRNWDLVLKKGSREGGKEV